jgi:hypothetical protein
VVGPHHCNLVLFMRVCERDDIDDDDDDDGKEGK